MKLYRLTPPQQTIEVQQAPQVEQRPYIPYTNTFTYPGNASVTTPYPGNYAGNSLPAGNYPYAGNYPTYPYGGSYPYTNNVYPSAPVEETTVIPVPGANEIYSGRDVDHSSYTQQALPPR